MKVVAPFHLPRDLAARTWETCRQLGGTQLEVPVLGPREIQHVWSRLDAAAAAWRAAAVAARVARLSEALQLLRARGPGRWRQALARSARLSPAGIDAAWEATFAPHDASTLGAALAGEGLDDVRLAALDASHRLPRRLVHVVAGNVLAPTLQTLLRGWLLGAAQWLRPAEREPLFAACLLAELATLVPAAAACTAVLWWPHDDPMQALVLEAADAVTVHGSDAAVTALQAAVAALPRPPRCIGYGTRWSAALVAAAAQTPETAAGLAADVALFDQQGCLSPTLVFAADGPGLQAWCALLAAALAAEEVRMPRGPVQQLAAAGLRHWHERVRLDVALGDARGLWEDGTRWGVVLRGDCTPYPTPLDRHVVVLPFTRVEEIHSALGAARDRLQGLAVALDGWDAGRCQATLEVLNPTRQAAPGALQLPTLAWAQDHRPPFASLLVAARNELNARSS